MRNDVKLGFAIGGVLLAVLIVYVLVVPGGSSQQQPRKVTQATQPALAGGASANRTGATSDSGKVTLEPVVPATLPAVPPPSFAQKTTPEPQPAKIDPFAPKTESPAAPEPVAKAQQPKNDDWNAILNQQPMLLTETPVASASARTTAAPTSTPPTSTPPTSVTPAAAPTSPASDSFANFTPDPKVSTEPLNSNSSASAAAAPTSQPTATGQRTHRIQQGETFASISTAAYGSSKYYPAIIKANPGVDPAHLKVGATITLPDIATPAVRPTPASADDALHASAHVASGAPAIDAAKQYRVQAGDSLYKISLKLYGKSDRADKIFQLNKQAMGDDPARLKVGQVLQLPEPPTNTTASSR